MREHYVWLIWSSAFLVPWLALYWAAPAQRQAIIRTGLATAPFGMYWAGAYEHVTWKHVEDSGAGQGSAVGVK